MSYEVIIEAFKEMYDIEKSMDESYSNILKSIKNKELASIIKSIQIDEINHEKNVKRILEIINS